VREGAQRAAAEKGLNMKKKKLEEFDSRDGEVEK